MNLQNNFCDTLILNMFNAIHERYEHNSIYKMLLNNMRHDGVLGLKFVDTVPDHYIVLSWVNQNKEHVNLFDFFGQTKFNEIVALVDDCIKIAEDFDIKLTTVDHKLIFNSSINTKYAKLETADQEYYLEFRADDIEEATSDVSWVTPVKIDLIKFVADE